MYGFDYIPANEGIKETFGNIINIVWQKIKDAAAWLRDRINDLGKWLRGNKNKSSTNNGINVEYGTEKHSTLKTGYAINIVRDIGSKTEAIIIECSRAINTMLRSYASHYGKVNKEYRSHDDQSTAIIPAISHMQKSDNISDTEWNGFQEKFGKLFTSMHDDAEKIKSDIAELQDIQDLSYEANLAGFTKLKDIYDANGKFGKEWTQLKTAHDFANEGKIKKAPGKIVSMYDVGINAAKAFAKRLKRAEPVAAQKIDTNITDRDKSAILNHNGTMSKEEIDKRIENVKESVILSRLYDIAYEDAMHDFELNCYGIFDTIFA